MKKIHKYEINPQLGGTFSLELPSSVELIHVAVDNKTGIPCMWFEFDKADEKNLETVNFKLIATGEEFDDANLEYMASYQYGPFVWHIYQITED